MEKLYDVYFTLEEPACFTISAKSLKEAKEIANEELDSMDQDEIVEMIQNAMDFMGFKIVRVEKTE